MEIRKALFYLNGETKSLESMVVRDDEIIKSVSRAKELSKQHHSAIKIRLISEHVIVVDES